MTRSCTEILLAIILCLFCPVHISGFCSTDFAGDPSYPYKLYQGSTLYETVRGEIKPSDRAGDCLPESMVLVARHGSRHPGTLTKNDYMALDNLHSIVNSTGSATLCAKDLVKIQEWKNWYIASRDKDLALTGVAEMAGLSKRFATTYPELFSSSRTQRFISSNYQRTIESARVFKNTSFMPDEHEIEIDQMLLRPWEFCPSYDREVGKNRKIGKSVRRFLQGRRITRIAQRLAARLGVPSREISKNFAETIHMEGCAREGWATGKESPWCLALTKRDKQVFEYALDMRDYLKWSFSKEVNHKQFCRLKHYVLSALRNATAKVSLNESVTSHFLFAHKPTIISLLTEMNLIEDDGPFRGRDFSSKLDRKFQISKIVPGGGNVAFVLNRCANDQMKLQVFNNERLLKLPLNKPHQDGLWDLDEALEYFGFNDPNDCNWDEICST